MVTKMTNAVKVITMLMNNINHDSNNKSICRSPSPPSRVRSLRWRRSRAGTIVVALAALLVATTAWLSLVFSGTTTNCWLRLKHWEVSSPNSWMKQPQSSPSTTLSPLQQPASPSFRFRSVSPNWNRSLSPPGLEQQEEAEEELALKHIVFGIAGSSQLWKRRKEFVRLWWRPEEMRGHVWLDEPVPLEEGDGDGDGDGGNSLPPIIVSEDISRFRYTNPIGHPSGLRISRIVSECFRIGLPGVRWFVLGDDDTIFSADNLVAVLSKYDPTEMVYIGSPSESHSANSYFSHSMAFGGGGIAISYPLAQALSKIQDECLERYPKLYGSDDRLHACITELGIPLTREHGFHQWDIRGNAHGLLASHPIAPFVSIHHVEAVDPFYPGLSSLESLKLFTKAMRVDPRSFLQRSICYDHSRRLTISVSLGYVVQVFPNIMLPRELEQSEHTYSAWNKINQRNEFDFDTRDPVRSICKMPVLFFLNEVGREGNASMGSYARARGKDDLRRKIFCFPRSPPLHNVQTIKVLGYPLSKNWHLVPRRLCCKVHQTTNNLLKLIVRQCERGALNFVTDSV